MHMIKILRLYQPLYVFLLCGIFLLCTPGIVLSQEGEKSERITSFDSWIDVEPSGRIKVIETISVVAQGVKIKRGIYRDFPTDYTTPSGARYKVGFTVLSVQRDGKPEPYHTVRQKNGVRLYIGHKDIFLHPGAYTYTIMYQTDRQVGFFDGHDELYWNVTGNGWDFSIDVASATLNLPQQAIIRNHSIYTGKKGSTTSDAQAVIVSGSEIRFQTTRSLAPREGLTFAASWQKGVIVEPQFKDEVAFFIADNKYLMLGSLGLVFMLVYYVVVWLRVGVDPEPEAIIPRFEPPAGYTPAAARFILQMGFDNKAFASALVNMAVKKFLNIENNDSTFTLKRYENSDEKLLSRGEKKIAGKLFSASSTLRLTQTRHSTISAAITELKKSLQADFEELHFKRNSMYLIPGGVITLLLILLLIGSAQQKPVALFMSVWLSGWTAGCYALAVKVVNAWKAARSETSNLGDKGAAIFITVFSLPFLGGWITGFSIFLKNTSIIAVVTLAVVLAINFLFYYLLKAPTIMGRRVMDKLEGLKMYLSVAEKDRLNLLNPPEKTPELFERLLPWALALDVEQEWSEQFTEILAQAIHDGEYTPTWYSGHHHFTPSALASSLGSSLSNTISSSATAPGSSSGSSGGGFSGGGGGGGGGGGW